MENTVTPDVAFVGASTAEPVDPAVETSAEPVVVEPAEVVEEAA